MLKRLPQFIDVITPKSVVPQVIVQDINSYIEKHSCEKMSVDISFLNVVDACFISTLCAANHFMKYPNGNITWKVSSPQVEEFNKNFELGNNSYIL